MPTPKILIIPGSLRTGSHNARLAALAGKELALLEAEVTRISLDDYALPLFDADLVTTSGLPPVAVKLKRLLLAHNGVFITSPEYTASVTPLIKNTIDWISRVRDRGETGNMAFKGRAFAIASASTGGHGGIR
jgi:chromate reductase